MSDTKEKKTYRCNIVVFSLAETCWVGLGLCSLFLARGWLRETLRLRGQEPHCILSTGVLRDGLVPFTGSLSTCQDLPSSTSDRERQSQ